MSNISTEDYSMAGNQDTGGSGKVSDRDANISVMHLAGEDCIDGPPSILVKHELYMETSELSKSYDFSNRDERDKYIIGHGSFGVVVKAWHKDHDLVAVKLAKPEESNWIKMYKKEIDKHVKTLLFDHIVSIKGFIEEDDLFGIVMEYMHWGSLWHFRVKVYREVPPWSVTVDMVHKMALGMRFLHSKGIIHRDLKLQNVLVDRNFNVKVADLGLATDPSASSGANLECGTDTHKPPEVFDENTTSREAVTTKYDVYSFAMTIYELLSGVHPYAGRNLRLLCILKTVRKKPPDKEFIKCDTPASLNDIMEKGWDFQPCVRPEFKVIAEKLEHLSNKYTEQERTGAKVQMLHKLSQPEEASEGNAVAHIQSHPPAECANATALDTNKEEGKNRTEEAHNVTVEDAASQRRMHHNNLPPLDMTKSHQGSIPHQVSEKVSAHNANFEQAGNTQRSGCNMHLSASSYLGVQGPPTSEVSIQDDTSLLSIPVMEQGPTNKMLHRMNDPSSTSSSSSSLPSAAASVVHKSGRSPCPSPIGELSSSIKHWEISSLDRKTVVPGDCHAPQQGGVPMETGSHGSAATYPKDTYPNAHQQKTYPTQSIVAGVLQPQHNRNDPYPQSAHHGGSSLPYTERVQSTDDVSKPSHRPIGMDDVHGRTEQIMGTLDSALYANQPTMPANQGYRSDSNRIISLRAPLQDNSFKTKLKVMLEVNLRRMSSNKVHEVLSLLERREMRDWWSDTGGMASRTSSLLPFSNIILHEIHLPEPEKGGEFILVVSFQKKTDLESVFENSDNLVALLTPCFVDVNLQNACCPAKPEVKIQDWKEQYQEGMDHFRKTEERSQQKNRPTGTSTGISNGASNGTSSGISSDTSSGTSNGAGVIYKGNTIIHLKQAPTNLQVGDLYHNHYYGQAPSNAPPAHQPSFQGAGDTSASFQSSRQASRHQGFQPSSSASAVENPNKIPEPDPSLTTSGEKVTDELLQDVADEISGDAIAPLGRRLKLRTVEVDNIIYSCRGERMEETAFQVLKQWMQQNGRKATKKWLAEALWSAKCYDAARSVR